MNHALAEDKNVIMLAEHLESNGMLQQKTELEGIATDCTQIEQLLSKLDELSQLLQAEKTARTQIEGRNEGLEDRIKSLEEGKLSYKVEQIFDAATARFMERTQALKQTYSNMKTFFRDTVADTVLDYKYSGRAALGKLSELSHMKGALTRMKTLIENGQFEIKKALNRCHRVSKEYDSVVTALSNITEIRFEEGKDINENHFEGKKDFKNSYEGRFLPTVPISIRMGQKLNEFAINVWTGLDHLFGNMSQTLERGATRVATFEAEASVSKEVHDILKTVSRSEPWEDYTNNADLSDPDIALG